METSRSKRLRWNTISSLTFQVTTITCGFILPRLILQRYGSQVNGLVNSITQFLHIIAFLELGVGAVVQSALYKPLADKDEVKISEIVRSAEKFFATIAAILFAYVVILMALYPLIVSRYFGHVYTATLIFAISVSSFAQYYFGIVDQLLLSADQRGYIQYVAQTITLILNTAVCAALIKFGASIHLVKLTTSCIYLLRPMVLRAYINRHYNLNRKIEYAGEPITQKWNGIAQHVAWVVLDQTDIIILTGFSTLSNVSVYSVYHLVIYGVKNLFLSLTSGFQALIGEMLAKEERQELREFFGWTEWILHTGTVLVFGCTSVLAVPFVRVYTNGVTDTNYIVPQFALLITLAHAGHCLRLPYNILILAAGHYRQTQSNYIIAAVMNILVSILTVRAWGLVGVAIGTLCAMFYQTAWMAIYDAKNILRRSMREFIKHTAVDVVAFVIAFLITYRLPMGVVSYASWFRLAIVDFSIWAAITSAVNYIAYREYTVWIALEVENTVKNIIVRNQWGGVRRTNRARSFSCTRYDMGVLNYAL